MRNEKKFKSLYEDRKKKGAFRSASCVSLMGDNYDHNMLLMLYRSWLQKLVGNTDTHDITRFICCVLQAHGT